MATKPTKPTVPDPALRTSPDTFSARIEANILFWNTLLTYMENSNDFIDEVGTDALAAVLAGEVSPGDLAGQASKLLGVNEGETAFTFFTALLAANNLSDVDDAETARTNLGLGSAAEEDASAFATAAQGSTADTALQPNGAEQLTAGFTSALDDDGTQSSGTYTPDVEAGNFKAITNGGAFTLAPPSPVTDEVVTLDILVTNNASAGAITVTGWDFVAGDDFTTTDGDKFACRVVVYDLGGTETSVLSVMALQ
jgi:hypothetical protein